MADVPDELVCGQPLAGRMMNHAAFTLGHLTWAIDRPLPLLGRTSSLPPAWQELFAMGRKPLTDRLQYPMKEVLLAELDVAHARLADAVTAEAQRLTDPAPEPIRGTFPTVGHVVASVMSAHFGNHLGQLSAWRRAMGFARVG